MSNLTTTKSKLTLLIEEFQVFHAEYKKKAEAAFNEAVQQFFVDNPDVQLITWTQYSPFFNDGDECVFSVNEVMCTNATEEECDNIGGYDIELSEEAEQAGKWVHPEWKHERDIPGFDELSSFISQNEDLMEELFGNHAQIIITRDGIQVDEYDHD